MDDEQRKGKTIRKVTEQSRINPQRDHATPRSASLKPLAPYETLPFHSKNMSGNREPNSQKSQVPDKSGAMSSLSVDQLPSTAAKDGTNNPALDSVESEQEPVPFFLEEKDSGDRTLEQRVTSASKTLPIGKMKISMDHTNTVPLINRTTKDTHGSAINTPKQSPEDTSSRDVGWKPLSAEHVSGRVPEGVNLPMKVPINGASGHIKAPLPPTGPKHRENMKNSGGGKGAWNHPYVSYKKPGQLPGVPTAPRSMRDAKDNRTAASPVISPTSESMQTLKAEDGPWLGPDVLSISKPSESPKESNHFQSMTAVTYGTIFDSMVKGLATDTLHVRGFPACSKQCSIASSSSDGYPVRGKLGCPHSVSIEIDCLSTQLPPDVHIQHFETLQFAIDTPTPMKRVPSGRSLYVQANSQSSGGHLQWHIVLEANFRRLSEYFAKDGKNLESGTVVLEIDELREAAKSSIPIYACEQQGGDLIYLPPRCWYQVTAVQTSMSLRVWHAHPLKAVITKETTDAMFASHRVCDPDTVPVRTMVYHHLRALYESISDPTKMDSMFKSKRDEKHYLQDLPDVIKLFDRILAEEYTQGYRQDEPRLQDPGSCDFCGTDIFHAAFVCSSKFGLWDRSLIPAKCCEVRLCPSCCSEGRSCVCGNLRVCSVFDYEELFDMRNNIWAWFLSREEKPDVPKEISRLLTASDIFEDLQYPHLALGAISILNIRNSTWAEERAGSDGRRMIVSCTGGALHCEEHEVSQLQSVTCYECYETICFKHLLSAGIHSWEAAFRREHDRSWHEVHTAWSAQWIKWSKGNISDPEDLLTILATSLPTCKPLKHTSVRLGFYDTTDPSLNCAKYEEDPILRWLEDKPKGTGTTTPNIELMVPALKALKTIKRKSETPGSGELSDSRSSKRKKKATDRDSAFNPRLGGRKKAASKGSKSKSRLSITTPVTPVEDEVETDESEDRPLRLGRRGLSVATPVDDRGSLSSPSSTIQLPMGLDAHSVILGATVSGPPSTRRSSMDYSPEQSSSVATPIEYYSNGNKDDMALIRQQMESLLREKESLSKENEDLKNKVRETQKDMDMHLQIRDNEITRLRERIIALENQPSTSDSASQKLVQEDQSMREPVERESDSELSSDSEGKVMSLVPY